MDEHQALWRNMSDDYAVIDAASKVTDINMPGYKLHPLVGERDGIWAISVSGNWRITFEFVNGDAYILDYEDYH
ncbi:type II toxin-antitoxin system RelE/ParE family toxin [Citrobacter portucalensis]